MLYPFITLADDTEIVHSDINADGTVHMVIETPTEGGFKSAEFVYPGGVWTKIDGYEENELLELEHMIMKCGTYLNRRMVVIEEGNWYVATEETTGITSQGKDTMETLDNLLEALDLFFKDK